MGTSFKSLLESQLAFLWPTDSINLNETASRISELNFRKKSVLISVALTLVTWVFLFIERTLRGDYPIAALDSAFIVSLWAAVLLDLKNKQATMRYSRSVINASSVVLLGAGTYLNGTLPLHLSPIVPVVLYLINPIKVAFLTTGSVLITQTFILSQRYLEQMSQPDISRLWVTLAVVWVTVHIGHCLFIALYRALDKRIQEQEEFSSVLAHEVRTPLATITGCIELAKIEGVFDQKPELYKAIRRSTDGLSELISSTLDYRRIKAGQFTPIDKAFKSSQILDSLILQAKLIAPEKNLIFSVKDEVPSDLLMVSDEIKIKQILINLLANAIKFTNDGGAIGLQSVLSTQAEGAFWLVSVNDSGIGIAKENLKAIFNPFFQVSGGANRSHEGTGLGLTLSQSIAEALGGSISVSSTLGKGSTFTLKIPVRFPPEQSDESKAIFSTIPSGQSQFESKIQVLLVDDHELNAEIAGKMFEHILGQEVTLAFSGEECVRRVEAGEKFDIILLDINLGSGMNGLQVTERIKAITGPDSPTIVALTAGVTHEEVEKIYGAGMDGLITKPINFDEVCAELYRVARLKGLSLPLAVNSPGWQPADLTANG